MIKYLGSKRTLLPWITGLVRSVPGASSVVDLFSGTARVGHALKQQGFRVLANDHNAYAVANARCYVEADRERVAADADRLLAELQQLPGRAGWFTETYCIRSRFIQPHNGARIEAIREAIAAKALDPVLESVLLVSLMEAADRVDSTTGVQMAYLKQWAPRSFRDLELRLPELVQRPEAGRCEAHGMDALDAASQLEADVAYLDPPYNQHSYLRNYHVWESLVRWDRPEVFGIACKRTDCKERNSPFNSRVRIGPALQQLLQRVRSRAVIVSFSNEGWVSQDQLVAMLSGLWDGSARVFTLEHDYPRYVGARIGIHNPRGERVGTVGHLTNKELIHLAVQPGDAEAVALGVGRLADRAGASLAQQD